MEYSCQPCSCALWASLRSRPQLVRALALPLILACLTACGGSESDSEIAGPAAGDDQPVNSGVPDSVEPAEISSGLVDTTPVNSTASPIDDTAGVMFELDDNSQLMLLADVQEGDESLDLRVLADPDLTGADMSAALGGAFFLFEGMPEAGAAQAVLQTSEPLAGILACNTGTSECELVLTGTLPDGSLVFDAEPDLYYAFEKVAP